MLRIISFLIINSLSFNVLAASVSTLYVDDAASHSERAFEVKNTSDVVEYITLSVERRLNKQNGKFTTQPMTDLAQQEVLVSPAYFVLAPNSRQTVRITPLLEKVNKNGCIILQSTPNYRPPHQSSHKPLYG